MKVKKILFWGLISLLIAFPVLVVSAFAAEDMVDKYYPERRITTRGLCGCRTTGSLLSSYNRDLLCEYSDFLLDGDYGRNGSTAWTHITACTNLRKYKDVVVLVRGSQAGQAISDWDYSTLRTNLTASVSYSFTPVSITHESITTIGSNEITHGRYLS